MGGQNHQPTNRLTLIAPSAWLSQKVGDGLMAVLEANNEIENAIIIAMNELHVEHLPTLRNATPTKCLERSSAALERSLTRVSEIEAGFDNLLNAAAKEGYTGNPLAPSIASFNLATKFSRHLVLPDVNERAWKDVESRIAATNVLATLRWEREQFAKVAPSTRSLMAVLQECLRTANDGRDGEFVEAIECNRIPLRQRYAQVFSQWNYLHAMFLYSALMMTDLFYRAHGLALLSEWRPEQDLQSREPELIAE